MMINFDWCPICKKILNDGERRKHDLAYHYDYILSQCRGNRQLLKEWVKHD